MTPALLALVLLMAVAVWAILRRANTVGIMNEGAGWKRETGRLIALLLILAGVALQVFLRTYGADTRFAAAWKQYDTIVYVVLIAVFYVIIRMRGFKKE